MTFPKPKDVIMIPETTIVGIHEPLPKILGKVPSSPICLVVLEPAIMREKVTDRVAVKAEKATMSDIGVGAPIDDSAIESGLERLP